MGELLNRVDVTKPVTIGDLSLPRMVDERVFYRSSRALSTR